MRSTVITLVVAMLFTLGMAQLIFGSEPMRKWKHGPPTDPSFFPISVWLQDPARAEEYRALGFNIYMGLWKGPTEEQLATLTAAGMKVICDQNEVGLKHLDDPTIIAWMHGDEPDNCQPDGHGGWGAPVPPVSIVADYQEIGRRDPSRPVLLNLGQWLANEDFIGTWSTLSDYPEYIKGCDLVSFDVYPVVGIDKPNGEDYLWYVAKGMDRLRRWAGEKPVWNVVECTHISNPNKMATPAQVKAEVWMSLIHGSQGIVYFVHQFKPNFIEAALLAAPEMRAAVQAINQQIHDLAPVLNSPTLPDGATATTTNPLVPVDTMVKQVGRDVYVFAVGMRNAPTRACVIIDSLRKLRVEATVTVIGENRTIESSWGRFEDDFAPYGVHLYQVTLPER